MIENYWFPSLFVFPQKNDGPAAIGSIGVDGSSVAGNLYSLDGVCVKKGVNYGDWPELAPGLYIWRSSSEAKKIIIR